MEKLFNTAGPNIPEDSYTIDPLSRFDLDEILTLIRQKRYFVLHAPRHSGKTSCMLSLCDYLNKVDDYIAVYANVEAGQAMRNNVDSVIQSTCNTLAKQFQMVVGNDLPIILRDEAIQENAALMLYTYLSHLSQKLSKPIVLIVEGYDTLEKDALFSVFRQIRSGYANRPANFPQTVILCGVRDVRDYRIVPSNQDGYTVGSVFNINAVSLHLENFTKEEIHELYMQHTRKTEQEFDEACFPLVWDATEGQPWLVNALAYEVTYNMRENLDRSVRIIPEMIDQAIENIILRRDSHINHVLGLLNEPKVKRIILPIVAHEGIVDPSIPKDDIDYCIENGLLTKERCKQLRISNGIYKELVIKTYK